MRRSLIIAGCAVLLVMLGCTQKREPELPEEAVTSLKSFRNSRQRPKWHLIPKAVNTLKDSNPQAQRPVVGRNGEGAAIILAAPSFSK